ncbi:MAG: FGGY-family carbohydrate kinase [Chloroflexota bacterium]
MSNYILAVDLGTSGPKVGLFSIQKGIVDYEFVPVTVTLLPQGGAEQCPFEWWSAIKTAIKALLERNTALAKAVVAVSCTSQWSGTVAVDKTGTPLMNAIIWMDSRGAPYIKQITGGLVEIAGYHPWKLQTWLRKTAGVPAHSGKDPIAHILYIKHALPEIYQQTYKFLEPKDYLNLCFTGKFAASIDSMALHWVADMRDLTKVAYDQTLLDLATLEYEKLPDLKQAIDILGPLKPNLAKELGLRPDVPVIMGTPDVQSAAIGSGAVKDYEVHLYLGTSSWIVCHVPFKKTDVFHSIATLPSAIPERYFVGTEQESAGACLNYLRDQILFPEDRLTRQTKPDDFYQICDEMVAQTPVGSNGLIFTPWLYGERTPVEDHTLRGGFHNLSLNHSRNHMIRAVFEGVACNSRWLLKYFEKFIKRPVPTMTIVGGGANADIWCQIYADVLGRTIKQLKNPILVNLQGAAFLALVSLGQLSFDQIPDHIQIANTYKPNLNNKQLYDDLFNTYIDIYKRNHSLYAALNKTGLSEKN